MLNVISGLRQLLTIVEKKTFLLIVQDAKLIIYFTRNNRKSLKIKERFADYCSPKSYHFGKTLQRQRITVKKYATMLNITF